MHSEESPQVGQAFNPCRKVCGFYPPDIVGRQHDLNDGPKRLYERMVRWAGKQGMCWYGFEAMADELGKSVAQVKRDMKALEGYGLVRHTRRGKRLSNSYEFLYQLIFGGDGSLVTHHSPEHDDSSVIHHEASGDGSFPCGDGSSVIRGDGSSVIRELYKENCVRESLSENVSGFQEFRTLYPEPKRDDEIELSERAYDRRICTPGEHEKLIEGLRWHLDCEKWQRSLAEDNGRFIPSMRRFIADGFYLSRPPKPREPKSMYETYEPLRVRLGAAS
jgi:hypothetical protein